MVPRQRNKVWGSFQHGFGRRLGSHAANLLIKNPILLLILVGIAALGFLVLAA